MASKSDKKPKNSKNDSPKNLETFIEPQKSKPSKNEEEDLNDELESFPISKKTSRAPKNKVEDDDEEIVADDIDEPAIENDDDDWDPDFDEFDLPKSKTGKKIIGTKKSAKDEDDDYKADEEFKDMLSRPSSKGFDDENDDY